MALIQWDPKYSVGSVAMDKHHQQLLDILNRLHDAMRAGTGRAAASTLLRELADYGRLHFSAEEKLMAGWGFPGLPEQISQHRFFVEKVEGFRERVEAGHLTMSMETMAFLRDWLTSHIATLDKQYAPKAQ